MRSYAQTALIVTVVLLGAARVRAAADEAPDAKAVTLLNGFMQALLVEDASASAKACLPFVHKSLLNAAGDDLTKDLREFGHKKAHDNAKLYEAPVKITRVHQTATTAIGFEATAEKGKVVDYFIAKKAGGAGMPAPIKVFFPADGGAPKISYMGSL